MSENTSDKGYKDLTPQESSEMIEREKDNPDFVILDVRTSLERVKKRIASATHFDFYKPDFKDNIDKLDRDKIYLVHCAVGGRSGEAARLMTGQMGFKHVYNLLGSLAQAQEFGLKTTWGLRD